MDGVIQLVIELIILRKDLSVYVFCDYPCGTEIFFNDVGGANDLGSTNAYGVAIGTVAIQAGGDGDGIELGTNGQGNNAGDQLTIYQLPQPTAGNQGSFVCMIQMDNSYVAR
jgi:hypothetical protein